MNKRERHRIIRELVSSEQIRTHAELLKRLEERGLTATQATLSRDLLILGIIKTRGDSYYTFIRHDRNDEAEALSAITAFIVRIEPAGNIVIVKTRPGAAPNIAAIFDNMVIAEVIGSIAGDDTIFMATSSDEAAGRVVNRLNRLIRDETEVK